MLKSKILYKSESFINKISKVDILTLMTYYKGFIKLFRKRFFSKTLFSKNFGEFGLMTIHKIQ